MGLGGEYHKFATLNAGVRAVVGDNQGAIAAIDEADRRFPLEGVPVADRFYLLTAFVLTVVGERDRANSLLARWEAELEPGLKRDPDRLGVQGIMALADGNHDEAIKAFKEWSGANRSESGPATWVGRAFEAAGEPDSAIAYYENYLEAGGPMKFFGDQFNLTDVLVRLGKLYEERGDTAKAVRYYGRFVDLWKNADPELQDDVQSIRARMKRLLGE